MAEINLISARSNGLGMIMEKNADNSSAVATRNLTGTDLLPKIGKTRKQADTLVKTSTKDRSFAIMRSII